MARPAQVLQGAEAPELDWELLYDLHAPKLRRVIERRVGSDLADDVLQETFLRAFKNRTQVDPSRPIEPWLVTIAMRTATEAHRRRLRTIEAPGEPVDVPDVGLDSLEEEFVRRARRIGIKHALASLNHRQRRLLQLVTFEGMSYEHAASAEDMTPEAVRSALARARTNFKTSYMGFERESGLFGGFVVVGFLNRLRKRMQRMQIAAAGHASGVAAATATVAVVAVAAVPLACQTPTRAYEPRLAVEAREVPTAHPRVATADAGGTPSPATPARTEAAPEPSTQPVASLSAGMVNDGTRTQTTVTGHVGDEDDVWSISVIEVKCDANPTTEAQCAVLRSAPLPGETP